jgi:hypothetical protein
MTVRLTAFEGGSSPESYKDSAQPSSVCRHGVTSPASTVKVNAGYHYQAEH